MSIELLFVHIPKAAGTSVASAIADRYGSSLALDYGDRPVDPASPMNLDPDGFLRRHHALDDPDLQDKQAIAGHFWIRKYARLDVRGRVTLLREPIQRALSHYCFWRSSVDWEHTLCRYVIENDLSFPEFCRLPAIRWLYTRVFFRDVDMHCFDAIGNSDDLRHGWAAVMASFGIDGQERRMNQSAGDEYERLKVEMLQDPRQMASLRTLFADDIAFFEKWAA